jgi:hypothetical protein
VRHGSRKVGFEFEKSKGVVALAGLGNPNFENSFRHKKAQEAQIIFRVSCALCGYSFIDSWTFEGKVLFHRLKAW